MMAVDSGDSSCPVTRKRHHRCKPDSNNGNINWISTKSSVENQMRGADAMSLLHTSSSSRSVMPTDQRHPMETSATMVLPTTDFLCLLKSVGAVGEPSSCGELFTVKQVCFYLKEYIKNKQLYDVNNPLVVHCESDPLGKVFNVKTFTVKNALTLVMKNVLVIDSNLTRWRHYTAVVTDDAARMTSISCASPSLNNSSNDHGTKSPLLVPSSQHGDDKLSSQDSINQVTSTTTMPVMPHPPRKQFLHQHCHLSETDDEDTSADKRLLSPVSSVVKHLFLERKPLGDEVEHRDKESGELDSTMARCGVRCQSTSCVDEVQHVKNRNRGNAHKRRHTTSESLPGCSFSKYIHSTDDIERPSRSWCCEAEFGDTDSDETIYSVQSKETVYVKDSSDDLWFLEEDDELDEARSIQSGHFRGEYELETEVESEHNNYNELSDGSESPAEFVVNYDDSDIQFWADSESENDSSDGELKDKWKCSHCGTKNQPLCRNCSRCWSLRPGWLPDQNNKSEMLTSRSKSDVVCSGSKPIQHSEGHRSHVDLQLPLAGVSSKHNSSDLNANKNYVSKSIVMDRFLSSQPEFTQSLNQQRHDVSTDDKGGTCLSQSTSTVCSSSITRDSNNSGELFKVPPAVSNTGDGLTLCSAKGRLLPCLKLPSDDSGNGSLTSSQESISSVSNSCQDIASLGSPLKKPRVISHLDRVPMSPKKCPASPFKRYSPFPASPYSSKENHFQFDQLLSPGKRLSQSDRHIAASSGNMPPTSSILMANVASPLKSESSRRIFFVDPLPSPKRRAPNGIEYVDLCMICLSKPKEASIIHGKTGHQVCCYLCAKRLRRRGKPCPVCRRHIQKVVKNYIV